MPGRVKAVTLGADAELWSGLLNRRVVDGVMTLDDRSELRFVDGQGVTSIELDIDGTTVTLP